MPAKSSSELGSSKHELGAVSPGAQEHCVPRHVPGDPLECVTSSRALPEDLGQNPLSQLSCAAKYCHDPRACGDLKYDNTLSTKCASNCPALPLPWDAVGTDCSEPGLCSTASQALSGYPYPPQGQGITPHRVMHK